MFHTDAAQSLGKVQLDVKWVPGIELVSTIIDCPFGS